MCVRTIIDASAFGHLCEESRDTAGHQLRRWILNRDGLVVYCPTETTYAEELNRSHKVLAILSDFSQRGRTEKIQARETQDALQRIPDRPVRRSDDPHILALAAAGKATVLFSCDGDLKADFANTKVLAKVAGTGRRRRSVPLKDKKPGDTTDAPRRKRFFNDRRCPAPP